MYEFEHAAPSKRDNDRKNGIVTFSIAAYNKYMIVKAVKT